MIVGFLNKHNFNFVAFLYVSTILCRSEFLSKLVFSHYFTILFFVQHHWTYGKWCNKKIIIIIVIIIIDIIIIIIIIIIIMVFVVVVVVIIIVFVKETPPIHWKK